MNRRHRPREDEREADEPYQSGTATATGFGGPVQDPRRMPRESALADLSRRALAFIVLAGCGAGLWFVPRMFPTAFTGQVAAALWMVHFEGPLVAVLAGTFGAIHTARYAQTRIIPADPPTRADSGHATADETEAHRPSWLANRNTEAHYTPPDESADTDSEHRNHEPRQ